MCANYEIRKPRALAEALKLEEYFTDLRQEYFPGFSIPTVRSNGYASLKWGLIPFWSKEEKLKYSTFNARGETIAESSTFREPFKKRRCLIPADGFFEWTKVKPKTRYRFETGGPFVIAGVWDSWGKEEKKIESVALITTRANSVLEPIHDRMPVILHPSDWAMWLDEKTPKEDLLSLLVPYDGAMTASLAPKGE